jgi:pyruvate,water dikinase
MKNNDFVLWLKEIDSEERHLVGQKCTGLAEIIDLGISTPNGFCVTSMAYHQFLRESGLILRIKALLESIDFRDPRVISDTSRKIKRLIASARVPEVVSQPIIRNYLGLGGFLKSGLVAVRSSPIDEKLHPTSLLNIKGEANVIEAVKKCWVSLFDAANLIKRESLIEKEIAVLVQKMVQSRVSGVIYSTNPDNKAETIIKAIYGLGELAVEGKVVPDKYIIDKQNFKIIKKEVNPQVIRLIKVGTSNKKTKIPRRKQNQPKLSDQEIIDLSKLAKKIQNFYFYSQEIEFAIEKRKIFILETQAMTSVKKEKKQVMPEKSTPVLDDKVVGKGTPATPGLVSGYVRIVTGRKEVESLKNGEIMVGRSFYPEYLAAIKKAAALVIEEESPLSYGAMIARELGIPCLVDAQGIINKIKSGMVITVNARSGEIIASGKKPVWQEKIIETRPVRTKEKPILSVGRQTPTFKSLKTATKIYLNTKSYQGIEKVNLQEINGLFYQPEFQMTQIGFHPKKMISNDGRDVFKDNLFYELENTCSAVKPLPVIYKLLDFRTDEFRSLIDGKKFEPEETNPILGLHGCSRYLADPQFFEAQLEVVKRLKSKQLKNLSLAIPFVRTIRELREVKKMIVSHGLIRSPSFNLWVMLEVPSNLFLLEELIEVGIDGICLNLTKLFSLTMAVDNDNEELFKRFEISDFYLNKVVKEVLKTCRREKIKTLVSGEEGLLDSVLSEEILKLGPTGLIINYDSLWRVREMVYEAEKRATRKN